ncbi:Uncharacterized phage-encoded protein [Cronobacter dublinensis 582]|nr:Uncharacterized phage-encoded protein [Cronobacter dublinensis 582]
MQVEESLGFRQLCKMLKVKEPEFRQFLLERNIMQRANGTLVPQHHHLQAGYFTLRSGVGENLHTFSQPRFSREGLAPDSTLIGARLDTLRRETSFRAWRFHVDARFATSEGRVQATLFAQRDAQHIDALRQAMQDHQRDVLTHGDAPTDPTSTLFYCGNALNRELYPQPDIPALLRDCERIQQLNQGCAALTEHRHWIAYLLSNYVERECLPRWFTVQETPWRERQYQRRPDAPPPTADETALLLYTALIILRFEPSYSKSRGLQFLTLAQQLGIKKAAAYLKTGTGALAQDVVTFESEQVSCAANDVLARVTVHIREESAAAYTQALAFLCRLLAHDFPRSYALKLKSGVREWLPIKGLRATTRTGFSPTP